MYTKDDLAKDLFDVVERMLGEDVIDPMQVTVRVIHKYSPEMKDSENFGAYCTFRHVRDQVGKYLAKRFNTTETRQDDLYGMLQEYYPCNRDDRPMHVKRIAMTLQERQAEVKKLRAVGRAYLDHADQLQKETDALIAQGFFDRRA